jgi:hypothetical protein
MSQHFPIPVLVIGPLLLHDHDHDDDEGRPDL